MKQISYVLCYTLSLLFFSTPLIAQLPTELFRISDMEYIGAFRIPASTQGASDMNYSEGPFVYNPANHSIFIVGHDPFKILMDSSDDIG